MQTTFALCRLLGEECNELRHFPGQRRGSMLISPQQIDQSQELFLCRTGNFKLMMQQWNLITTY